MTRIDTWLEILDARDELSICARAVDRMAFVVEGVSKAPWMTFLRDDVEQMRKRVVMAHAARIREGQV